MSRSPNKLTIEDACAKVEGLDILNNCIAKQVFCKVAIDYTRDELRQDGVDLFAVAKHEELYTYCRLWLGEHPGFSNDLALIGISHAIRSNALEIHRSRCKNQLKRFDEPL